MRVLSWNVRGLESSVKRMAIRKVLRQQRVEMVYLLETKLEQISDELVNGIWWTDSFSFIASPSTVNAQFDLWRRLGEMFSVLTAPVYCGGDFNVVLSLEERRNCVGDKRVMDDFVTFVEEMGFLNLPAVGKAFSWYGPGLKASRLDPFLVSLAWVEKFCGLEQFIL
ncbi:hypothetical protein V6N13_030077 [Hibiscus sabdariffa]